MIEYVPGYTPQSFGARIPPVDPTVGDPRLTAQVRDWLSRQAQLRAGGGAASIAPSAVPSVGTTSTISVAAPTSAPVTGFGARALKYGKMGAKFGAPLALTYGATAAALDSQENVSNLAESVGADYNTTGGRIGSNFLNFLTKTGDAATLGGASALGRGVANVIGGQPFFEPYKPAASVSTAKPVEGSWGAMGSPQEYSGSNIEPAAGVLPPVEPFTAEDIRGDRVPVSGTGAFVNNRTGVVKNFDTRTLAPVVTAPAPERDYGSAGNAIGAMMNQRRGAAIETRGLATNKMLLDYALKAPAASESAGKAQIHAATLDLARRAADSGATPAEVSAILANRAAVTPSFGESITSLPDSKTGAITVLQKTGPGAGTVRRVTPQQKVTEANIQGFLKDNPRMTRAQAIMAHREKGMDVSGL